MAQIQLPLSARVRTPSSGRNNLMDFSSNKEAPTTDWMPSTLDRGYGDNSYSSYSRPTIDKLRNSESSDYNHKAYPPILPKSRFPTDPPRRRHVKSPKKMTLPEAWVTEKQKPELFEHSSLVTVKITEKDKEDFCKDFVERNKDKLWQFDVSYLRKSPQTVYVELLKDKQFISKANKFHNYERNLSVSGSEQVAICLIRSEPEDIRISDPYINTLTTSREQRAKKMMSIIAPALMQGTSKMHNRGVDHTPGYGNFSKFNAVLKANAGATLKR